MAPIATFDMSYIVGRCSSCGFNYAYKLPDESTYATYYAVASKYDTGGLVSPVDQARIDRGVSLCHGRIAKDARVVDLGCGSGALLAALKASGWSNLAGVDPAPRSVVCAKEQFGLDDVFYATIDTAHQVVSLEDADVVLIMAVLEHLPNLRDVMFRLLKHIRVGCKILVEVPALEYFSSVENEPFGEFSLEHIQYFSSLSLQNLFESLGARTILLETFPLTMVGAGSLFGLFEYVGGTPITSTPILESESYMSSYVAECQAALNRATSHISPGPIIVYGAGSHTARLLPILEKLPGVEIVTVVDNNENLQGKTIGKWAIQPPQVISEYPFTPVLVSSYRAQDEIANSLRGRYSNPLVVLYQR